MATKTKTELTPSQEELKTLLAEMSKETREVAQWGSGKLATLNRGNVKILWQLGKKIHEIASDPDKQEKYGQSCIPQLARFWYPDRDVRNAANKLWDMKKVVERYSKQKEIDALTEKRMSNGNAITFKHLVVLASVTSDEIRKNYEELICTESMSANQLQREITARKERARSSSGGRRPTPPKSPAAFLQKTNQMVQTWENVHELVEEHLFSKLANLDDIDINTRSMIDESIKRQEGLIGILKKDVASLKKVKQQLATEEGATADETPRPAPKKKAAKKAPKPAATKAKKKAKRKRTAA